MGNGRVGVGGHGSLFSTVRPVTVPQPRPSPRILSDSISKLVNNGIIKKKFKYS